MSWEAIEFFKDVTDPVDCQTKCQDNDECFYWTVSQWGCGLDKTMASTYDELVGYTSGPKICGKYLSRGINLGGIDIQI